MRRHRAEDLGTQVARDPVELARPLARLLDAARGNCDLDEGRQQARALPARLGGRQHAAYGTDRIVSPAVEQAEQCESRLWLPSVLAGAAVRILRFGDLAAEPKQLALL